MGKIKEVLYEEIDESIYSNKDASEFQFLYNMMDSGYMNEYEEFEKRQLEVRNKILKTLSEASGNISNSNSSVILGTSDYNKKVVLICDL
jgi:hypothetical protein